MRFRENKNGLNPQVVFLTGRSKVVPLYAVLCASVVSYVAFVLPIYVPHLSFFGKLCFMIVACPGYLHLYFHDKKRKKNKIKCHPIVDYRFLVSVDK